MVKPGEIYWAEVPNAARRPVIVVSREPLNRGQHMVVVPLTTAHWERRRKFANCVPFAMGEYGLPKNCVAQTERITTLNLNDLDLADGPVGELDDSRQRDLIRAIGFMLDAECEPA